MFFFFWKTVPAIIRKKRLNERNSLRNSSFQFKCSKGFFLFDLIYEDCVLHWTWHMKVSYRRISNGAFRFRKKTSSGLSKWWLGVKWIPYCLVTAVDDIIGDVRQALEEHNTAASQALADSIEAWHITSSRNFSQLSGNIREHITMAENVSDRVEQTLKQVCNHILVYYILL